MAEGQVPTRPKDKRIALVVQGGGALGAYQAGVYEVLEDFGFAPDWLAGTSIGAFNAAIIAGNRPGDRVERLRTFWNRLTHSDPPLIQNLPLRLRQAYSLWSAGLAFTVGRDAMFNPRYFNPLGSLSPGRPAYTSFYDTSPMRTTLEELVDFDLLNKADIRLSVGAVKVSTGEPVYFDTRNQRLGPEHVMASGSLPPGFPAVEIDGESYWDGGIFSNTPLNVVLDDDPRVDTLCFMVDLWAPEGPDPGSVAEVLTRYKDLMYASRSERHIEAYRRTHNMRRAIRELYRRLPASDRQDPELRELAELGCHTTMNIVRLVYPGREWELTSKDVNFSRATIQERWEQGRFDAERALRHQGWLRTAPRHEAVLVHELPRIRPGEEAPEASGERDEAQDRERPKAAGGRT